MVAEFLKNGNLFQKLMERAQQCALLSAYPPRYFEAIQSGRRMYSAIPLAATSADLKLMSTEDIQSGQALSADLTGPGWRKQPGFPDIPELTTHQAGARLANLGLKYNFSFFEYWLTDYAGHQQDINQAVNLLENFDEVLGGLLETWDDQKRLVLITSDHGNLEDLSSRRHTARAVPGLVPRLLGLGCVHMRGR